VDCGEILLIRREEDIRSQEADVKIFTARLYVVLKRIAQYSNIRSLQYHSNVSARILII